MLLRCLVIDDEDLREARPRTTNQPFEADNAAALTESPLGFNPHVESQLQFLLE